MFKTNQFYLSVYCIWYDNLLFNGSEIFENIFYFSKKEAQDRLDKLNDRTNTRRYYVKECKLKVDLHDKINLKQIISKNKMENQTQSQQTISYQIEQLVENLLILFDDSLISLKYACVIDNLQIGAWKLQIIICPDRVTVAKTTNRSDLKEDQWTHGIRLPSGKWCWIDPE